MDQKEIADSLSKHLDQLADVIKWSLLFAVVFWWAGFARQEQVEALGIKIQRSHALWVGISTYSVVNLTVLLNILRIGDLLTLIDEDNVHIAVSKVFTHSWPLNPFAYFGPVSATRFFSNAGFGTLIFLWWVCNSSLYGFTDKMFTLPALLLQLPFLYIGLASMYGVNRVHQIILNRMQYTNADLYQVLLSVVRQRVYFAFAGIAFGAIFTVLTQWTRYFP